MEEDLYYGDEFPDLSEIDEDMLRAYLEGNEVNPELEELLKAYSQEIPETLTRVGVRELWENCLVPTFSQTLENLLPVMFLCFVFKLTCSFSKTDIDQLTKILTLVGSPCEKLLAKISSEEARNYIQQLPKWEKKDFKHVFQGANPHAIDLLERMLDLDADPRITAEQALAHPYLAQYADPSDEPTADRYDQSFEDMELSIPEWRKYVYDEVMSFKPPSAEALETLS